MVFHPGLIFFLQMVSHPGQFPYCSWMVSYPGHGTRIARGFVRYKGYQRLLIRSISEFLNPVPQEMSWHQNCKRIGMVQLLVMSIKFTCRYSSTWCHERCHGTRDCKRCLSTSLYELLSLNFNSLFSSLLLSWSVLELYMCIVVFGVLLIVLCFINSVPPLMGQVLGKVLLTSWKIS